MLTSLGFRDFDVAAGFESGSVLQLDIRNLRYLDLFKHNSVFYLVYVSYSRAVVHNMHSTQPALALDISVDRRICCGGADGAISIGQLCPPDELQSMECPPPMLIATGTRGSISNLFYLLLFNVFSLLINWKEPVLFVFVVIAVF